MTAPPAPRLRRVTPKGARHLRPVLSLSKGGSAMSYGVHDGVIGIDEIHPTRLTISRKLARTLTREPAQRFQFQLILGHCAQPISSLTFRMPERKTPKLLETFPPGRST